MTAYNSTLTRGSLYYADAQWISPGHGWPPGNEEGVEPSFSAALPLACHGLPPCLSSSPVTGDQDLRFPCLHIMRHAY